MQGLNIISGIFISLFMITAAVKGNADQLIFLAKRDKAFLKWAFAVAVLSYLYSRKELRGAAQYLIGAAFLGLFLTAGSKIFESSKEAWKLLE